MLSSKIILPSTVSFDEHAVQISMILFKMKSITLLFKKIPLLIIVIF